MAAFSAAGSIFLALASNADRRRTRNKALNAARSISGGTITSTPCPFNDISIAVCCLDRMARVMVKTTACRIGRPRASSSSCMSAIALTLIVASRVVARIGVSTRSACEIARDTSRDATPSRSTTTIRPSASLLLDRPYNLRFAHVRFNRNARWKRRAVGPDRDRAVWIAIEDHDLRAGIGQLGSTR